MSNKDRKVLLQLLKEYRAEHVYLDSQLVDCCTVVIERLEEKEWS